MMDRMHDEEENMVAQLYKASLNGCVSTLNTLIQRDPLILDRVSLTSLSETPLHITALHGNLEFCIALVSKKPKLAEEVDSLGRTPLHLASAEGHTEIVQALLQTNKDVCLTYDQDGRIPLHLAAMRGRIEILKELIIAQRESILVNDLNGDSILYLCVRYSHLEALKSLVESTNCNEILNSKDQDGNSVLHLAVMLKQMKVVKYLLSIPEIKKEVNAMNKNGYSALDVLEVNPRDFKYFEIQNILKEAGVRRSAYLNSSIPTIPSADEEEPAQSGQPALSWFRRRWECVRSSLDKRQKYQKNWIDKRHGTLMIVATVMATMAFQAGISPPGGVWQLNTSNSTAGFRCSEHNICQAGKSVLSYHNSSGYLIFLNSNTISFFASLCVILLVISEFPLRGKFFIWLLTSAMIISVASMTVTYLTVVALLTSDDLYERFSSVAIYLLYIWTGLVLITGLIHIIRLLHWLVKKLIHIILLPICWMLKKLHNFLRKLTRVPAEDPANV